MFAFVVLIRIIESLIDAYIFILVVRMLLSWVNMFAPHWRPRGVVRGIINVVYRVTQPPLRFLGRFIPPLRIGRIALDVSFLVLYFVLIVLQVVLQRVAMFILL